MSAAIKRLSTIIRPHPHTQPSSASSPKEPSKTESSPAAPAAPEMENNTEMNSSSTPAPKVETSNDTSAAAAAPADLTLPSVAAEQAPQEQGPAVAPATATDAPATTEANQPTSASTEPTTAEEKVESPASPTAAKKSDMKHETTSVKERSRRTRDIGRDTIRRFSTILRPGNGSQQKEKDTVPPIPTPAPKAKEDEAVKPAEGTVADTELPAAVTSPTQPEPTAPALPVPEKVEKTEDVKPVKPAKPAVSATKTKEKEKDKTEKPKTATRRGSSFFSAARDVVRGPRKDPSKSKQVSTTKSETIVAASKIVKKGAAKGKRVVVITGASKGTGLELVKQYAVQKDTFVIALSRTVDKAAEIRTLVNESAKHEHNVRPVRVDIGNPKSIAGAVKDIVELTDGRIDLLIHAAGTQNERTIRIGDIKGPELEEEFRYNVVGPIALTNALLPYLKPFPPPPPPVAAETKEADKVEQPAAAAEGEGEAPTDKAEEPKAETKVESNEETKAETDKEVSTAPEAKEGESAAAAVAITQDIIPPAPVEVQQSTTLPVPAPVDLEAPSVAVASAAEPTIAAEETKQNDVETAAAAATVPLPADSTPVPASAVVDEVAPPVPASVYFPNYPCVVFLTPSDPIFNNHGSVIAGSFVPTPRTLFSMSRSALQVAIAKYGSSLSGQAIGVVGVERPGVHDPHTHITVTQAATSVVEYLPSVTLNQSGKLLKV